MKQVCLVILLAVVLLALGCESEKDQYSRLGELVAQRQGVREAISEKSKRKKELQEETAKEPALDQVIQKDALSASVLYEKQVEILDADSRIPLARGVAYINKSGQIVRIKIHRN